MKRNKRKVPRPLQTNASGITPFAAAVTLGLLAGCTAGNICLYPPEITSNYLITMGESPRPYLSKGFVQITGELVESADASAPAVEGGSNDLGIEP